MKKMKKFLAVLMTLIFVCTALSACGNTSKDTAGSNGEVNPSQAADTDASTTAADETYEPITIQFWNSWTGADGELLTEMVDQFNETNKYKITIEMNIMPSADMMEKMATSMVAGTAAQLILYNTSIKFTYGAAGQLADIGEIFEKTSLVESDFNADVMELGELNGVNYFIPMQACSYYMLWNKDLFTKAGLDPDKAPATWEEWAEYASKITDKSTNVYGSGVPYNSSYINMACLQAFGGAFIEGSSYDDFKATFGENVGYQHWLETLQGLINSGDNPLDSGLEEMFKAGQIGMVLTGPWLIAGAKENNINYGVALLPAGDNGIQQPLLGAGFGVTSSASEEEKLAAFRFIEWWMNGDENTEKSAVKKWSLEIGYPAFYQPVIDDPEYSKNQDIVTMTSYTDYATQFVPSNYGEVLTIANDIVVPMLESVAYGGDPATELDSAQEKATKLIEDHQE